MSSVLDRYRAAKGEQGQAPAPSPAPTSPAPTGESVMERYRKSKGNAESPSVASAPAVEAPEASPEDFSVSRFLGNALMRPLEDKVALGETALALGGGMVGEALGGLSGIAALPFGGAKAGSDVSQTVSGAIGGLTAPRSERGQKFLDATGAALAPVGDALTYVAEASGDTAFDLTGSPAVATVFYTLPDAALEIAGAGLGGRAVKAGRVAKNAKAAETAADIFNVAPTALIDDAIGSQWTINKAGEVVENAAGKRMVKEGFAETDAAMITNSNKATRTQMSAMTQAFDDLVNGKKASRSGATARTPQYFVGQNIVQALDDANKVRQQLGKRIDALVEGDLGQTRVSPDAALDTFFDGLTERGITVRSSDQAIGGVKAELDFRGSKLDYKTYQKAQPILQDAFAMVMNGGDTLADVHKLKRQLDDLLDAGKMSDAGVIGDVERFLGDLRRGLNDTLSQVNEYRVVNDDYRLMADSMSYFDQFKPAGVSWDSPKVRQAISRTIPDAFANTTGGQAMLENLTRINDQMVRQGSPFSTAVGALSRYADHLNKQWEETIVANRGGRRNRQFRNNTQGLLISAGVGNTFGVANNFAGLLANGMDARSVASIRKELARKRELVNEALRK